MHAVVLTKTGTYIEEMIRATTGPECRRRARYASMTSAPREPVCCDSPADDRLPRGLHA